MPEERLISVDDHVQITPEAVKRNLPGTLDRRARGPFDFPELKELPGFYFHRQMHLTFFDDELGLRLRHELGVENVLWSSDYPHPDTTWPRSREVVERQFAGVPAVAPAFILSGNARRLYGL